ncbi:MAG: hypothetical protein IRZ33_10270, partial [Alicyclobacillaceae bacterium]|nr:hypothetical protein [Alicyclobacillaceae bacterium]
MRRLAETSILIVLSVVTVSATATVIHDAHSGRSDPVARWLRHEWESASRWAKEWWGAHASAGGHGSG